MNAPDRGRTGRAAGPADVIVVGAGPAGAVSGLLLAQAGLRVIVLDRAPFPRPKPCGDCLSAAATGLLDRLGLLGRVMAAGPASLDGWRIVAPAGHGCEGRFGGAGALAIERHRLDAILLDAAIEAGAGFERAIVDGLVREAGRVTGVRVRRPDGSRVELAAAVVVGADGLRSIVARQLGLIRRPPRLRKVSLTFHGRSPTPAGPPSSSTGPGPATRGEMRVLDGGCIGFAPVGGGRYNITLVVDHARTEGLAGGRAHAFLFDWLRRAPGLRERVAALELDDLVLASGPFDRPTRAAVAAGAALVGDAAGYYDPFTGQGVHHAMLGASILAGELIAGLAAGDIDAALARYDRRVRAIARSSRRLQRLIEWALARPGRADRVIDRLGRAPAVADRLIEVTGDLRPPRSLLSPPLLSSFLLPAPPEAA